MKAKLLFFLLCATVVSTSDPCFAVFNANDLSGSRKFGCYDGNCQVQIPAHPKLYTNVEVVTKNNNVKVWIRSSSNLVDTVVMKGEVSAYSKKKFVFGPEEGAMLDLKTRGCKNDSEAYFEFKRMERFPHSTDCNQFVQIIDHKIKIVQPSVYLEKDDDLDCPYYLLPSHPNDTLYILSPTPISVHNFDPDEFFTTVHNRLHVLHNFKYAFFYMQYSPKGLSEDDRNVNEIIAVTTNRSCTCDVQNVTLQSNDVIKLQSPGYPDFMCPNTTCNAIISVPESSNSTVPNQFVERMIISYTGYSQFGVSLKLKSNNSQLILNEYTYQGLATSLLLDMSNVNITFQTPVHLSIGKSKGHFKMVIRTTLLHKDCECSMISNQGYRSAFRVKVEIPAHCPLMSCYWRLEALPEMSGDLELQILNGGSADEFHLWNSYIIEIWRAHQLAEPKRITLKEERSDAHMVFWRTAESTDATVLISWKPKASPPKDLENDSLVPATRSPFITGEYVDSDPEYDTNPIRNDTKITFHRQDNTIIAVEVEKD